MLKFITQSSTPGFLDEIPHIWRTTECCREEGRVNSLKETHDEYVDSPRREAASQRNLRNASLGQPASSHERLAAGEAAT